MRNLWLVMVMSLGLFNVVFAAVAKTDSKKDSKTQLNLEIKSLADAKKLYTFLKNNSTEIVNVNITYNPKADRKLYVSQHPTEDSGCEIYSTQIELEKSSEIKTQEYCMDASGLVYHIGANQIGKDRAKMNDAWKKQNNDVVLAAALNGEMGGDYTVMPIEHPHISFEEYRGEGVGYFWTIYINGVERDIFDNNKISGVFYVNNDCNFPDTTFLENSSGDTATGDYGTENAECLILEKIDDKIIKAIKYFK